MSKTSNMSIVPPADADDEARLRLALGQRTPDSPTPSSTVQPLALEVPTPTIVSRETISIRITPKTKATLAAIGKKIGWSSNQVMTAIVEQQVVALETAYETEGAAGVLNILLDE